MSFIKNREVRQIACSKRRSRNFLEDKFRPFGWVWGGYGLRNPRVATQQISILIIPWGKNPKRKTLNYSVPFISGQSDLNQITFCPSFFTHPPLPQICGRSDATPPAPPPCWILVQSAPLGRNLLSQECQQW